MAKKKESLQKNSKKNLVLAGQPKWWMQKRLHLILIFSFGFLLYANTFGHQYTQDDAIVITDNMFTTEGFSGIGGILKYDTFYGFFKEAGKANLVAGGRYRPFSLITFAIEYAIFGLNPTVSHIINALLYGLTCLVLYLFIFQAFPTGRYGSKTYWLALLTACIFAAHPLHTEAVANIKGRDEILSLLGSLAALLLALKAFQQKRYPLHFIGAGLLFLALLSKENAITFVAIIPLSLYFFTSAKIADLAKATLPYLAVAGLFMLIRTSILGLSLGDAGTELMNNPFLRFENGRYIAIPWSEQLATVMFTLGKYVQLLIFPHPLTHDYYPRHVELMQFGNPKVLLSLVFYLGLLIYAIRGLLKKDLLAYAILFYLITLSIVSNLFFPIGTNMAERLTFMPSVGFCLAVSILLYRLAILLNGKKKLRQFKQLQIPLIITVLFVIGLAAKTVIRNMAWKDNYTLFTTDIQTSYNSAKLRNAVGGELINQFYNHENAQLKNSKIREAVGHLQEAVRIHPLYKNAYLLLGNAHYYLNEYDQSIAAYQKALALDGGYTEAIKNIGIAYRDAGKFYGEQQGDVNKALQYLNLALPYQTNDYETLRLLGVANGVAGNGQKAVEYFTQAADANPESADAWYNLGTAHLSIGNTERGNAFRQKALSIDPQVIQRMGNQ
jgi:tetratricopeptide (TPR) repeat protein